VDGAHYALVIAVTHIVTVAKTTVYPSGSPAKSIELAQAQFYGRN
jgi:hypothetical protein